MGSQTVCVSQRVAGGSLRFGELCWQEQAHSIPHFIDCYRLHAGAGGAGLHFAEEEAWLSGGMMPEGYVFGVVERVGAVFLGAGWTENGDDGDVYGCCEVHGAAVVADEEGALFELRGKLADGRFACEVRDGSCWYVETFQQASIEVYVLRSAD